METNHAMEQAKSQMQGITEMVAALECDYERLEVLKSARQDLVDALEDARRQVPLAESDLVAARARPDTEFTLTVETAEVNLEDAHNTVTDAKTELAEWDAEFGEELAELSTAAGDCENYDEAYDRIQEDPLSVEVRSGWHTPGGDASPEEFMILLCTGGPAVRIIGKLDQHGQPCAARIEYQDWFTPWIELRDNVDETALLTYCQQFYFGEC